jgi:MoaA/NifB/PqqE/SkfB family radical SAM enzyme
MEWSKKNEFNSFNSWKGLLYADWYKAVMKGEFLPPIEASLDPIHDCNLSCNHCNAHRYIDDGKTQRRMPSDHMDKLIDFLGKWGVKAICFGGGGEPTLHDHLPHALYRTKARGMKASVATNGTLINNKDLAKAMADTCRWVGISVDSANPTTYRKNKGKDLFNTVISNIKSLAEIIKQRGSECDISFKFLITPYNQEEIYQACKIAKELGVKDFHARPADFRHQGMGELKRKENEYVVWRIKKEFELCHDLGDEDFRVFTVMHKFTDEFIPRKDFSQCYAAPICIQLCADYNVYFCVDQRHQSKYILGQHFPPEKILEFWGGEKHKKFVFGNTPKDCTTRCTFGTYCRQCEQLFTGKNPMCWEFV